MKRVTVLEEELKRKTITVYPSEAEELSNYLDNDNKNFSDFVRMKVKEELKRYRKING